MDYTEKNGQHALVELGLQVSGATPTQQVPPTVQNENN